jgi:ABC-type Na+ efflux pump permease subunit
MERNRAWITSITIGVMFIAATGAVMANTGLLSIGPVNRNVGRLTAGDLAPSTASATTPPTTTAATQLAEPIRRVVVKYEDVYVTAPVPAKTGATAPVARKKVRLSKVGIRSTRQAKQTIGKSISVQAKAKSAGSTADLYSNDEQQQQQHGEEGDD